RGSFGGRRAVVHRGAGARVRGPVAAAARQPALRGAFRVPLGIPGLAVLAALPILLIVAAVGLEASSREIGLPGVLVAGLLAAAGPVVYAALRGRLRAKQHLAA